MSNEIPKLVPVPAMAKALACSRETVRRLVRSGDIPAIKLGREIRLDPAAVIAALNKRRLQ